MALSHIERSDTSDDIDGKKRDCHAVDFAISLKSTARTISKAFHGEAFVSFLD